MNQQQIEEGLQDIYRNIPTVKRSIAQDKALIEIINNYAGREVAPTWELLKLAYDEQKTFGTSKVETVPAAPTFQNKEAVEAAAANKVTSQELRIGLDAIYAKYPLLRPSVANDNQIIDLCRRWTGEYSTIPSVAIFDALSLYNDTSLVRDVRDSVLVNGRVVTYGLIDQIIDHLASRKTKTIVRNERTGYEYEKEVPTYSEEVLKAERIKMQKLYTDRQVRDRYTSAVAGEALKGYTTDELKDALKDIRKDEASVRHRFAPFKVLPKTVVNSRGETVAFDKRHYAGLTKVERDKANRDFGYDQINARFRGEV